jgi:putative membrane protein
MMGLGFGGAGAVYLVIFWIVIMAVGIWLLSNLFPRSAGNTPSDPASSQGASSDSPQEILERRYASGEITKAEFDEIRRDLRR